MKFLLITCVFLTTTFAMASEITCVENSNSDYELHLIADAKGNVVQISLNNTDWGGKGRGNLQSVVKIGEDQYKVVNANNASIQVDAGTIISLQTKDGKVSGAALASNSQGPSSGEYYCSAEARY